MPLLQQADRSKLISAISNVSIQYNFSVIALALALMDNTKNDAASVAPAWPRTETETSNLKAVVFAGAITGQLLMGYAGDRMGRKRAMILTNMLTFIGALASALFTWGSSSTIYSILTVCRFVLGVGVGGKYPLAATMRSETTADAQRHISTEVAKGFFWQIPGSILPYLVGLVLLACFGPEHHGAEHMDSTSLQFRLLLGFGAIPAFVVMFLAYYQPEPAEYTVESRPTVYQVARANPRLLAILLGTGLSWFLYDVLYYGVSLVTPKITDEVFGKNETLLKTCWQGVILNTMGLPACLLAVWLVEPWGSKKIQIWGFAAIAIVCAVLATLLWADGDGGSSSSHNVRHPWVIFTFVALLIFALNLGVNVSTYVLPTELFPSEVKSTLFGASAAAGKLGAVIGGYGFDPFIDSVGFAWLYVLCGCSALLGVAVTYFFVENECLASCCNCPVSDIDNAAEPLAAPEIQ